MHGFTHNVLMQAALECGSPQRAVAVFDAMLDSSTQVLVHPCAHVSV